MPSPSELTRNTPDFSQPFRFCGVRESVLQAAALAQWPDGYLPWTIVDELPRISFDDLKAAMTRAWARWAAVCNLQPTYTDTARNARLLVGSRAIDGPGRVLAECELPMPGMKQCRMWFDVGEDWALDLTTAGRRIILELVGWHEGGHGLGLGHAPDGSANVMAPIYNPRQLSAGAWDIQQIQARYGKPVLLPPTPPPAPTPTPSTPSGGFIVNFKAILDLLNKIGPLLDLLQDPAFQALLDKLVKLFGNKQSLTADDLDALKAELESQAMQMRAP